MTKRRYPKQAVEAANRLVELLDAIDHLNKQQSKALIRMLCDAHRVGYEMAEDVEWPLGRDWSLSDTDIIGPVIVKLCGNTDSDVPKIDGLSY